MPAQHARELRHDGDDCPDRTTFDSLVVKIYGSGVAKAFQKVCRGRSCQAHDVPHLRQIEIQPAVERLDDGTELLLRCEKTAHRADLTEHEKFLRCVECLGP